MTLPENVFTGVASRIWWIILLRGILLCLFGLIALMQPLQTVVALVWVLALFWVVDGVILLIASFTGTTGDSKWWLVLLRALLGIVAGVLVLVHPVLGLLTAGLIVYILAFGVIFSGVTEIFAAFRLRKEIEGEWSMVAAGLAAILLGGLLLVSPLLSVAALTIMAGILALIFGAGMIYFSIKLRSAGKRMAA